MKRTRLLSILFAAWMLAPFAGGQTPPKPPLGLGEMTGSAAAIQKNEDAAASVQLGRTLFFDPSLSADGTVSCATCHVPEQAFAQAGVAISKGVGERSGRRNAPSLLNVGYAPFVVLRWSLR